MTSSKYFAAFVVPMLAVASCSQTPPPATEPVSAPVVEQVPVGPDPSLVRAVQSELSRLGYLSGPADGVAGRRTVGAIRTFERSQKMRMDGMVSQRLLARLRNTTAGAAAPAPADTTATPPAADAPAPAPK